MADDADGNDARQFAEMILSGKLSIAEAKRDLLISARQQRTLHALVADAKLFAHEAQRVATWRELLKLLVAHAGERQRRETIPIQNPQPGGSVLPPALSNPAMKGV